MPHDRSGIFGSDPELHAEWRVAVQENDGWLPMGLMRLSPHVVAAVCSHGVFSQVEFQRLLQL